MLRGSSDFAGSDGVSCRTTLPPGLVTGARTAVREVYPLNKAPDPRSISAAALLSALERAAASNAKGTLKDALSKELDYGPALIEHALLLADLDSKRKVSEVELSLLDSNTEVHKLLAALEAGMRPEATSVRGLQLLVYAALNRQQH